MLFWRSGPILDPEHAELAAPRHRAFADLCGLLGVAYKAPVGVSRKAPGFGTLALATTAQDATLLPDVRRLGNGRGDTLLGGRPVPAASTRQASAARRRLGRTTSGALAASVTVAPGATVEVPFLLTWHYPNKYNEAGTWMGCHYATAWPDAAASCARWPRACPRSARRPSGSRTTFYDSTLPYWLLDCLTSQAAIIRHIGVVFRIANGDIYGWEGSNGCCQPTCTHVWGYEQTLSRLFPDLERDMRRIDFSISSGPTAGSTTAPTFPRRRGRRASSRSPTATRAASSRPIARPSITRTTPGSGPTGRT